MDNKIVFVTHNTGKIKSAERYFKRFNNYKKYGQVNQGCSYFFTLSYKQVFTNKNSNDIISLKLFKGGK